MSRPRTFSTLITALPALSVLWLLGAVPLPVARGIARGAGRIALLLVPKLRRVANSNLTLAFGEGLPAHRREQIITGAMDSLCITVAELCHLPRLVEKRFEGHVRIEDWEHLDRSNGAVFIGGHIANWEYVAAYFGTAGYPVCVIYREMDNPWVDHYVNNLRQSCNFKTIEKDDAAKEAIPHLKAGGCLGLMVDQAPRENAVPVTWFGVPCWATVGPAMLALRARKPVHHVSVKRHADGSYTLKLSPPLPLVRTGNLLKDLVENTQIMQDALEQDVRDRPEQWLWFHKRWKARPRLEQEWAQRVARQRPSELEMEIERAR